MQIKFSNGKTFTYTQAFGLERDFKDGYTRPSLEVIMPLAQTSYNEIESIISDADVMKSFTLIGDAPEPERTPVYKTVEVDKPLLDVDGNPIIDGSGRTITIRNTEYEKDENGNLIVDYYETKEFEAPTNIYTDYTIAGKITVEDGIISFKLYKMSDTEIENEELTNAVDKLLIAMEV